MQKANISLFQDFLRNKYVLAIIAIDIAAIIAIVIAFILQANRTAMLSFDITPIDAIITVNGDTGYSNGNYSVSPGKYEIKISHENLETKTFNLDIKPKSYNSITTFLSGANHDFEFYEYKDSFISYQRLVDIASTNKNITTDKDKTAEKFIEDFNRKLSIRGKLPIIGFVSQYSGYTIRDGESSPDCDKATCLRIIYHGINYEEPAMDEIRNAGYNPDDYQIVYERYKD